MMNIVDEKTLLVLVDQIDELYIELIDIGLSAGDIEEIEEINIEIMELEKKVLAIRVKKYTFLKKIH